MLLAEELLLVALDPLKGRPVIVPHLLDGALAGALVAELELAGLVTVGDKKVTVVAHGSGLAPPVLADTLAFILANDRTPGGPFDFPKPHNLQSLLHVLDGFIRLRRRLATGLADVGVLGIRKHRILEDSYPLLQPDRRDEVLGRLRAAAVHDGALDSRTAALLAIAGVAGLLTVIAPARVDRPHAEARVRLAVAMTPVAPTVEILMNAYD